jgi:hypothetical protein
LLSWIGDPKIDDVKSAGLKLHLTPTPATAITLPQIDSADFKKRVIVQKLSITEIIHRTSFKESESMRAMTQPRVSERPEGHSKA